MVPYYGQSYILWVHINKYTRRWRIEGDHGFPLAEGKNVSLIIRINNSGTVFVCFGFNDPWTKQIVDYICADFLQGDTISCGASLFSMTLWRWGDIFLFVQDSRLSGYLLTY